MESNNSSSHDDEIQSMEILADDCFLDELARLIAERHRKEVYPDSE